MIQHAIAGLPARTGRSLEEWVAVIRKHGPRGDTARREWLKKTHKLGTNYAWQAFNHHLAHVMEIAEPEALTKPRMRHNLDALAWQPADRGQSATLEYFMRDYVGHLKHHLRQVFPT